MSVSSEHVHVLLGELGRGQRAIRELLDRLEREPHNRGTLAEELSRRLAAHNVWCADEVVPAFGGPPQRIRLLRAEARAMNQLADRLRLPDCDPRIAARVLASLRALVREHGRLELEIVLAAVDADQADQPAPSLPLTA
jgi:hypothetical protein